MEPKEGKAAVTTNDNGSRRRRIWILVLASIVIAFSIAVFVSVNTAKEEAAAPTKQATPEIATIKITNNGFEPAALTVKPNTVVVWVNSTNNKPTIVAANPYPADNSVEGLKSNQLGQGASYRYLFKQAGIYKYHDDLNPTVSGSVTVQ